MERNWRCVTDLNGALLSLKVDGIATTLWILLKLEVVGREAKRLEDHVTQLLQLP